MSRQPTLEAGFCFSVAVTAALMALVDTIRSNTRTRTSKVGCGTTFFGWLPSPLGEQNPGCSRIAFEVILHIDGTRKKYQTLVLGLRAGC